MRIRWDGICKQSRDKDYGPYRLDSMLIGFAGMPMVDELHVYER